MSYLAGLVQADGKRDLEFNRNAGDAGDLFPGASGATGLDSTTTPSTHANNGMPTGVALSQISDMGGVVKVRVKV